MGTLEMGVRAAPELRIAATPESRIAATTENMTENVENKKSPHNTLKSHTMGKYSHVTPYHFPLPVNSNESKQDPSTSFSLFPTDGNFRKSEQVVDGSCLDSFELTERGKRLGVAWQYFPIV